MDTVQAITTLSILAQSDCLAIFRILASDSSREMTATRMAAEAGLPRAKTFSHLAALEIGELVKRRIVGKSTRYRCNLVRLGQIVDFLTEDCCGGRPELCEPTLSNMRALLKPLASSGPPVPETSCDRP